MTPENVNGLISEPSNHSVEETTRRLQAALQAKGIAYLLSSITAVKPRRWACQCVLPSC